MAAAIYLVLMPITIKRLHDVNMSGAFYLVFFIPCVSFVFGLYLLFKKGTDGPNDYGDDPLQKNTKEGGTAFIPQESSEYKTK